MLFPSMHESILKVVITQLSMPYNFGLVVKDLQLRLDSLSAKLWLSNSLVLRITPTSKGYGSLVMV